MVIKLSLGLGSVPITRDQVNQLAVTTWCPKGPRHLLIWAFSQPRLQAVLPDYLWRFRPSGQYAALKESRESENLAHSAIGNRSENTPQDHPIDHVRGKADALQQNAS